MNQRNISSGSFSSGIALSAGLTLSGKKNRDRPRFRSGLDKLGYEKRSSIQELLEQTLPALEQSPLLNEVRELTKLSDVPSLGEIRVEQQTPVEPSAEPEAAIEYEPSVFEPQINAGNYIKFALNMMLTCAEDMVLVDKFNKKVAAGNHSPTARQLKQMEMLHAQTVAWLLGYEESNEDRGEKESKFFSFYDCARLLEDELRIQSLDQVEIPAIAERSQEMAQWLIRDPYRAKEMLSRYASIFTKGDSMDETDIACDDMSESEELVIANHKEVLDSTDADEQAAEHEEIVRPRQRFS